MAEVSAVAALLILVAVPGHAPRAQQEGSKA